MTDERSEILNSISDISKDANGVRDRTNYSDRSTDELRSDLQQLLPTVPRKRLRRGVREAWAVVHVRPDQSHERGGAGAQAS